MTSRTHLVEVGLRWPPEAFLRRKFESLADRGFRVTAVSVLSREQAKVRVPGVTLLRLPAPEERPLRVLAGVLWNALALVARRPRRLRPLVAALRAPVPHQESPGLREALGRLPAFLPLARLAPDVVHFEWPWRARFYLPIVDVWGAPYVISCRSGHYEVPAHTSEARSLPLLFRRAAAVHCVCDTIERAAIALHGLDSRKSWVVRPAVDTAFFRPAAPPEENTGERFRVITVGRLSWYKGHEYALDAVRRLVDEGVPVRFDVVGDGSDRARVMHAIADLRLEEHVHLHGHLEPARVRDLLHSADVLVQPSVAEGLPNSVLEAMACGLPVVVTDCGGVREAVTDGVEGIVVPRRDPGRISDSLLILATRPDLRSRLGAAARARVETEFALAQQTQRLVELYRNVTSATEGVAA